MYALYNDSEQEYAGINLVDDEIGPQHTLTPYSHLDKSEPYLYVARSEKQAQSLIDLANAFYGVRVPIGIMLGDFVCNIENISDYKVVKMDITPPFCNVW